MSVFRRSWEGYFDRRKRMPSSSGAAAPTAGVIAVPKIHPSRNPQLRDGTFAPSDLTQYQPRRLYINQPAAISRLAYPSRIHPSRNPRLRDGTYNTPDLTQYQPRRLYINQPAAISRLAYPSRIHPSRNPRLRDGTFDTPDLTQYQPRREIPSEATPAAPSQAIPAVSKIHPSRNPRLRDGTFSTSWHKPPRLHKQPVAPTRPSKYYVDSNAIDDTGIGTIDDPWQTITAAGHLNSMQAGDIMYLRGGADSGSRQSYQEAAAINPTTSGTADKPITIRNYPGEFVEILGPSASAQIFRITGSRSYWTISGEDEDYHILINRNSGTDNAFHLFGSNIIIEYCEIKDTGHSQMINIEGGSDITIRNCYIYDGFKTTSTDSHGIKIEGSSDSIIVEYCKMHDFAGDPIQVVDAGATPSETNLTFRYNEFWTGDIRSAACSENAIDLKNAGAATLIHNNIFHGFRYCPGTCGGSGANGFAIVVHQDTADDVVEIYDNEFYDISGGVVNSDKSLEIWGNVIHSMVAEAAAAEDMFQLGGTGNTFYLYNNTINGKFGATDGNLVRLSNNPTLNFYNNLCNDTSANIDDVGGSSTINADYNGWFGTATRHWSGANDVVDLDPDGDPFFVDEANDDYRLKSKSGAVDQGTVQSPYTDGYKGAAPDIGYYETQLPVLAIPVIHPSRNPQLRDGTFAPQKIHFYIHDKVLPPTTPAAPSIQYRPEISRIHPSRNPRLRDGTFDTPDLTQYQPRRLYINQPAAISRLAYPSRIHPSRNPRLRDGTFDTPDLTQYQPRRLYINQPAAISRLAYPSRIHPSRNPRLRDGTFDTPDLSQYQPRRLYINQPAAISRLAYPSRIHPSRNPRLRDGTFDTPDLSQYQPRRLYINQPAAISRLAYPSRIHPSRNPRLRDGTFDTPDLTQYQPRRALSTITPAAPSVAGRPEVSRIHPSRNPQLRDGTFDTPDLTQYQPRRLYINQPAAISRLAYPSRIHPSRNLQLRDTTFRPPDQTPYRPRHDLPHSRVITLALFAAFSIRHPSRNISLRDSTFRPISRVYYRVSHAVGEQPQAPSVSDEVLFKGMWKAMFKKMR